MTYRIAQMTSGHLDMVAALEKVCFPEDPWSRRLFAEVLEGDNSAALLALAEDGGLLGYLVFSVVLDEGNVDNIAVSPQARQQGIAMELMKTFHYFAKQWGVAFITLEVRASNGGAIALYEKLKYIEVGRRTGYYLKPREDAIIMRLELAA